MTTPMTAPVALSELSDMFPNSEPCGGWLKITWKDLVFLVGQECDAAADIEMGPDDLIVDIYPAETWDETTTRTDVVQVVVDAAMAVSMIDGMTDDAPEGYDHTVWAMESAMVHFAGCALDII